MADLLSATSDQQIRIDTATGKMKLMVLGGNIVENSLAGEGHKSGLDALIEFLLSAKAGSGTTD